MLSYQHAYHAGSRTDIHKHDLLARALETLFRKDDPVTYAETHAGRGIYDLGSAEALKTGEAAQGWLKLIEDKDALQLLSPYYLAAVRALNNGKLVPRYPGSPSLAAHILRTQDKLRLMEMHPTEYAALKVNLGTDKRIRMEKRDGLEGLLQMGAQDKGLVLVDPSYEVKTEYEDIPKFVVKMNKKWPQAVVLVWVPMLPALRHEPMVSAMKSSFSDLKISEITWASPDQGRGMYGSIMMGINAGVAFQSPVAPFISKL